MSEYVFKNLSVKVFPFAEDRCDPMVDPNSLNVGPPGPFCRQACSILGDYSVPVVCDPESHVLAVTPTSTPIQFSGDARTELTALKERLAKIGELVEERIRQPEVAAPPSEEVDRLRSYLLSAVEELEGPRGGRSRTE
jgi:hypothetical protein